MQNKQKTGRGRQTALIVLCVVLALILVLLVAGTIYVEHKLSLINRAEAQGTASPSELEDYMNEQTETMDPDFTGEVLDPDDVTWDDDGELLNKEGHINIMLIGQDRREGQGRSRSDSMILCNIDTKTKTITLTSFLRDMYVQIPGYEDNRINVSYFLGGMELLDECLEKNFGVRVDGNVEVDFFGFMDIIDLLGGVDIKLTQQEANYLNRRGNWDVSSDSWSLYEGVNRLNGSQALAYSRIRDIGTDFGRTERQRNVLTALTEKAKGLSLGELNRLLNAILPLITTDMSNQQIIGYAMDLFPMLGSMQVQTLRIPADGAYQNTWIRGMSVLLPDLEANRQILQDAFSSQN